MRTYHHLSLEERERLYAWEEAGLSLRRIALRLGRNVGTISRELRRHTRYGKPYLPCLAQRQAERWAKEQRYKAPLKCPAVFLYVRENLREGLSPETIAGRLPLDLPGYSIDDESIYRYVYGKSQRSMGLWQYLALHRKRRLKLNGRKVKQPGRIKEAVPISERPKEANLRLTFGHWESDNLEGKRSDQTSVSVTVERKTRLVRLRKLADHTAETKTIALVDQLKEETILGAKTLTLDRGVENSYHQSVTQRTGIEVYFCQPYHSWEKGTVENTIGRTRRFIPKGTSVDGIDEGYLNQLEIRLNNTPRKCLGFLTSNEVLARIQTNPISS